MGKLKRRWWCVLGLTAVLSGCAATAPLNDQGQPPSQADLGLPPVDLLQIATEHMRYRLKDPDSARIEVVGGPRSMTVKGSLLTTASYGWGICYRVNGKNSYGAYVGWRLWVLIWRNGQVVSELQERVDLDQLVSGACRFVTQGTSG